MLLLAAFGLVAAAYSAIVQAQLMQTFALPNPAANAENGSPTYKYFDDEAKATAGKIYEVLTNVDKVFYEDVQKLKVSNNATLALNSYNDLVNSLKGTKCEVSKDDAEHFSGAQKEIDTMVENCASYASHGDRETLKKKVLETVAKIQAIDYSLRTNSALCTSLRVPRSDACVKAEKRMRDELKNFLSHGEMAKLNFYGRNAFFNPYRNTEGCLRKGTEDLEGNLATWSNTFQTCKEYNKL